MTLLKDVAPRSQLKGHLYWFLVWLGVTVLGAFVLRASPLGHGTHTQLGLPPCGSVIAFDRPCPGCGLTTSWTALLHGNVAQSFAANLFGPLLYLGYTVSAGVCLYGYAKGRRFDTTSRPITRILMVTLLAFIAYGVVRFATKPLNSPFHLLHVITKGK